MTRLADGLRSLRREYPRTVRLAWGVALLILAGDLWVAAKGVGYARETARLRDGMSGVERARLDAALVSDSNRLQVMIELARRQARGEAGLHLSVAVDSGVLYLEEEGAVLRTVRAEIGPDAWIGKTKRDSVRITAPRGARTIVRLLDDTTIVLNGGALIYARLPGDTSASARPGSVRMDALELRVLMPNLRPGQRVYFY
jgi:hypothetical protein